MKNPSKIEHPLKNRTGTSQRTRLIEALDNTYAPIDGKTLADRLNIISKCALQINFYEYQKNQIEGEYQELDDWSHFFKNSLPFQLSILSKVSTANLDEQFTLLYEELKKNPSKQSLESLFNFILNKIITPTSTLYTVVEKSKNSFSTPILAVLQSSFVDPLKILIELYNASATFLCIRKKNFASYLGTPWQFSAQQVYKLYDGIQQVKKGKKEAFLLVGEELNGIFYQLLSGFITIIETASDFIEESLIPLQEELQKRHEPHLALLFTFLDLFTYLQENINDLGRDHLDFFYEKVLKIIPKGAVPDKAHIVFEVAKHLNEYPLQEGLLLKNGKDINKQDIQFGLDHEVILDKAKIAELRTLSLYKKQGDDRLEGVYIAPIANSVDGLGKEFKKEEPSNWATLGTKYSKWIEEGKIENEEHPQARLGFVLSSPVLLLQEGKRTIDIVLDCELPNDSSFTSIAIKNAIISLKNQKFYSLTEEILKDCLSGLSDKAMNFLKELLLRESPYIIGDELKKFLMQEDQVSCEPIFSDQERRVLCKCLTAYADPFGLSIFDVTFSGEEAWITPKPTNPIEINMETPSNRRLKISLKVKLDADDPAVVFYDAEKLGEKFQLQTPFPTVKIELNPNVRVKQNIFDCDQLDEPEQDIDPNRCCLKKEPIPVGEIDISPYHFLKPLQLVDTTINVEVCGVKNLIVQNDDNLQDVNKPMLPFGPRPKVGENWFIEGGANFYIGSKEIFCKNWEKFWIHSTWKDKPGDLHEYYRFYRTPPFENGDEAITNLSFRFATSLLNNGQWVKDDKNKNEPPAPFVVGDPSDGNFDLGFLDGELLPLFGTFQEEPDPCNFTRDQATFTYNLHQKYFAPNGYSYVPKSMTTAPLEPLTVNTRKGFARLTLAGVSFQHDRFTYVLTRQMMALADLVDPQSIANALNALEDTKTLADKAEAIIQTILADLNVLISRVELARDQIGRDNIPGTVVNLATVVESKIQSAKTAIQANNGAGALSDLDDALSSINGIISALGNINTSANSNKVQGRLKRVLDLANAIKDAIVKLPNPAPIPFIPVDANNIHELYIKNHLDEFGLDAIVKTIGTRIDQVLKDFDTTTDLGLPKDPYTPLIKSLSIDYKAKADSNDIDIVHLYPYENTSKVEVIDQNPTLFPFHDNDGTLFVGIDELVPGGNLSILFQLAEATAESEMDRAIINWHYLSNNNWLDLKPDFNIISDETNGLTVSGIVTIAVPDNINKIGNTIMPDHLYWIKVSTPTSAMAVAETIGIHTQAAKASARLTNLNDTNRLNTGLEEGSIGKLVEGDFSVKKVEQLYKSYGGRQPEAQGHYYVRVSEHLKHKGRAQMLLDYEKIVLEAFSEIYKVKCISHTMGLSAIKYQRDLEVAPGFIIVTVIPDLTKLESGNQLGPKAPVSLLEKIGDHLRKKTSPFSRIKVMNPRYEYVDVTISVRLRKGKSHNFYQQKLKEDIVNLLAPWFLGDSEKIAFGQSVFFSDIVGFVERLAYVDFITNLVLEGERNQKGAEIKPLTARSVLTAGKICVKIDKEECVETKTKGTLALETITSNEQSE